MTTTVKIVLGIAAMALVVAGLVYVERSHSGPVAGAINTAVTHLEQGSWWFSNIVYFGSSQQTQVSGTGAVTVGSSGTAVNGLNWSNCSLIASSFTVAASTTVPMDCAITGATSGDFVMAQFGTSSVIIAGGWRITGASASSTANFDTLQVRNDTGASNVMPAQIASSTRFLNLR